MKFVGLVGANYDQSYKWNKMFRKKGLWWMKAESTLAKMISTAGEKAAYDTACKRLLAK